MPNNQMAGNMDKSLDISGISVPIQPAGRAKLMLTEPLIHQALFEGYLQVGGFSE
jgi:hypothetical protein